MADSEDFGGDSVQDSKILLVGLPKSGKSSIARCVFSKVAPHETLFFSSTHSTEVLDIKHSALLQFLVLDIPGKLLTREDGVDQILEHLREPPGAASASSASRASLVYVIDAQEDPFDEAIAHGKRLITSLLEKFPKTEVEIFVHKSDGEMIADDEGNKQTNPFMIEIQSKLQDELGYLFEDREPMGFYSTSIYDHTLVQGMSRVVQRLLPQLRPVEELVDVLVTRSRIDKGFLFDVVSKIFVATDSNATDLSYYELLSDMIDVVIDISCIYGLDDDFDEELEDGPTGLAYDDQSSCVIQLNQGQMLYLRQVNHFMAFACLLREENFDQKFLLDSNLAVFNEGLKALSSRASTSSRAGPG